MRLRGVALEEVSMRLKADTRQFLQHPVGLLRDYGVRPHQRRAANQRHELAPPHFAVPRISWPRLVQWLRLAFWDRAASEKYIEPASACIRFYVAVWVKLRRTQSERPSTPKSGHRSIQSIGLECAAVTGRSPSRKSPFARISAEA